MNGLQYIRIRCNLSLSELAEQLGVSRQAISSWENGKKEIPEQRKTELAEFFGVDKAYLGEISDEEKTTLLEKAMFRQDVDGKEKYSYRPNPMDPEAPIVFIGERDETLDESFNKARQRKKALMDKISDLIDGGEASCLVARTGNINRGCELFEIMTTLLDQIPLQDRFMKVPYRLEMQNVFDAMLIAYAAKDKDSVNGKLELNETVQYQDYEFILELANQFTNHWENKKIIYDEMYGPEARKKAREWYKKVKEENDSLSREEQIARAEADYKESAANGKVYTSYFK